MGDQITIFIMRHGTAENYAQNDAARQLVEHGKAQVVETAAWYNSVFSTPSIDLALVSPYVRAQQTFDVFNEQVSVATVETFDDITPEGNPYAVHDYLDVRAASMLAQNNDNDDMKILLVSHMPFVSFLLEALCPEAGNTLFNTAAMAVIKYQPSAARGQLLHHFQGT
ncbi:phosphohistidine phosphatase SixA [Alteromonas sediminis]|uniref:Phosphohistidine phosphatase SixA n=1 Tax=Alteromonas sediminis TaxID=2259342 RepID=A0A3N5Y5C7_9ALTE|nr:phosphohistidine phosphatase SixA [Alteromonas sediminis]RPJ68463.1 phosphohistidine phosphatase SixA [Alteromonas sediminis]